MTYAPTNCGCGGPHVPGRACTPELRAGTLLMLLGLWNQRPTERLGQLLTVAVGGKDLFYVEDEALIEALQKSQR